MLSEVDPHATLDDLYTLAQDDVLLYNVLTLVRRGDLPLQQALISALIAQTKARLRLEKQCADLLARLPPEPHRFVR